MPNPIDNGPRIPPANVSAPGRGQPGKAEANAPARRAEGADAATESDRLQQIRDRIDSTGEIDMERVEAIKQALAEGRFALDPQRVAAKFAELEGLLNG